MDKLLRIVASSHWAITYQMYQVILSVASGQVSLQEARDAVSAKPLDPLDGTMTAGIRNGVAIIPITGIITPRRSLFSVLFGGASVEAIARDFTAAVENPDVRAIVFNVDSPGGNVTGINELNDMIYAARGKKRIESYLYGSGSSAAYWLPSATSKITMNDTAEAGSIGVVSTYIDWSKWDEKMGVQEIEVVSSQSPKKRLRPTSKEGRDYIQSLVDELAGVFIGRVARNRGVSPETVISDFGQGGVMVGQSAVDAGLADALGSLESVIDSLSKSQTPKGVSFMNPKEILEKYPEAHAAILAEGKTAGISEGKAQGFEEGKKAGIEEGKVAGAEAERERIKGIEALASSSPNAAKVVAESKFDAAMTKETMAVKILEDQAANPPHPFQGARQDGQNLAGQLGRIDSTPAGDDDASAAEKEGEAIAKAAPGYRR